MFATQPLLHLASNLVPGGGGKSQLGILAKIAVQQLHVGPVNASSRDLEQHLIGGDVRDRDGIVKLLRDLSSVSRSNVIAAWTHSRMLLSIRITVFRPRSLAMLCGCITVSVSASGMSRSCWPRVESSSAMRRCGSGV